MNKPFSLISLCFFTLLALFSGCSSQRAHRTGELIGVPQTMTQNAAKGYIEKTTGASQTENPYNR